MFLQQLPPTRSSTHKLNAAHAAPYVGLGDPPILQPETICCVIDISSIAPIPSPIPRALVCDNSMPINYCDITPHFFSSSYAVLLCIITSNSSPKTCTSSSTGWELSIDHKTHLLPPPWASIFVNVYPSFTASGATLSITHHVKTDGCAPKNDS